MPVQVDRVVWVPKNSWAEKTAVGGSMHGFFLPGLFTYPDHPDHPDQTSVYAAFRKSLTRTIDSLHLDHPDHFPARQPQLVHSGCRGVAA